MNKILAAVIASTFALGTLGAASSFAADTTKKKEELTAEQKTEIRDRVDRMKADRAKADQGKATPAAPAKTEPKRSSIAPKAKTASIAPAPKVLGTAVKKVPAKV